MADRFSLHAIVRGHVQGVSFRAFIREKARELRITGYTRNLPSGSELEVQAEGNKGDLEKLLEYLKVGPPAARVENVIITWSEPMGKYHQFVIRD